MHAMSALSPYTRYISECSLHISKNCGVPDRIILDYELMWIKNGAGAYALFYENDRPDSPFERVELPPGSFLLVRPGERHGIFFEEESYQPHLHFDLVEDADSENLPIIFRTRPFCSEWELAHIREDVFASYPIPHRLNAADPQLLAETIMDCTAWRKRSRLTDLLAIKARLITTAAHLVSVYAQQSGGTVENAKAQTIRDTIVHWYAGEQPKKALTLDILAEKIFLNKYYLTHLFTKEYGMPPMQYAANVRLNRADAILASGRFNIAETAAAVGFERPFSFSRFYKSHRGYSPAQFLSGRRKTE